MILFVFPPGSHGQANTTRGSYDSEVALLGRDILNDGNKRVAADGDWSTVEAQEHVRRSMIRRIITPPGTYRRRPGYGAGLAVYVKKPFTSTSQHQMVDRIKSQVSRMRQVEKVVEVTMTEEVDGAGNQFVKVFVAAQILGRRVPFRPFSVPREV